MRIELITGGALVRFLPKNTDGNRSLLEIDNDITIQAFLSSIGLTDEQSFMLILNSTMMPAAEWTTTHLAEGDQLSLVTPVQAG
ncbi:MAG: sulfur carrier protein ThiS [Granulosicoccus sp.]